MEEKRSSLPRSKRSKPLDEGAWECSVCTYRNSQEAFKCEMCDVRKGTSTRKPRLNSQLVAQQVAQQFPPPPPKKEKLMTVKKEKDRDGKDKEKASTSHSGGTGSGGKKSGRSARLKNIDRSSGVSMEVTVGSLTVVITDYKPKKDKSVASSESNRSNLSINSDSNASSTDLKSESSQSLRVDTDEESRDGLDKKS